MASQRRHLRRTSSLIPFLQAQIIPSELLLPCRPAIRFFPQHHDVQRRKRVVPSDSSRLEERHRRLRTNKCPAGTRLPILVGCRRRGPAQSFLILDFKLAFNFMFTFCAT